MALLLEWWELPVLFRWTFVKQDCRIREILELKNTTETCKSTFLQLNYRSQFWQPLKMAHDPNYFKLGCFHVFSSPCCKIRTTQGNQSKWLFSSWSNKSLEIFHHLHNCLEKGGKCSWKLLWRTSQTTLKHLQKNAWKSLKITEIFFFCAVHLCNELNNTWPHEIWNFLIISH